MEEKVLGTQKSAPLGADALKNSSDNGQQIQGEDERNLQKEQLMQIVGTNQLPVHNKPVAIGDYTEVKLGKQNDSMSSAAMSDEYKMYQTGGSMNANEQRAMTAPNAPQYGGRSRFKLADRERRANAGGLNGMIHQTFVESDLLKAANIYSQFEKKGNLYENRLYAKTSINQAKLTKEQKQYDHKMKDYPDEMYRINNGSQVSKQEAMGQTNMSATNGFGLNRTGKSVADMRSTGQKFSVQNRSQSQSMANFTGNANQTAMNFTRSPMSEAKNTAYTNFCVTGGLSKAGTFSQANGPKVTSPNPYQLSGRVQSLFQKVIDENDKANKDQKMNELARSTQNISFGNVQKSLSKFQGLQSTTNVWSLRDQNLHTLNKAIGGKQHIFKKVNNFTTNEPKIFADCIKNSLTDRNDLQIASGTGVFSGQNRASDTFYLQYNNSNDKKVTGTTITDRATIHRLSKAMNHDGRIFYGKCMDEKGSSNVVISDVIPAGLNTHKKQTKAYRSNTQSRQLDGLYKPDKFAKKPQFMNMTRVDYDLLRPNQVHKEKYQNREKGFVMGAMYSGKTHSIYGISDFNQNARLSGIKYHEKYQDIYTKDNQTFKRQNGEYTTFCDTMKWSKF